MRLFAAATLPDDVRERLGELQRELGSIPLELRWVRPEGIHLTLKFLGEAAEDRLNGIREVLEGVAAAVTPFRLEIRGVGSFPERGTPRVIWVGLGGEVGAAETLSRRIDAALEEVGFPAENRAFKPHLTLGRVKGGGRGDWRSFLRRFASFDGGEFPVSSFVLFQSRLATSGATYHPLAVFALSGGGER